MSTPQRFGDKSSAEDDGHEGTAVDIPYASHTLGDLDHPSSGHDRDRHEGSGSHNHLHTGATDDADHHRQQASLMGTDGPLIVKRTHLIAKWAIALLVIIAVFAFDSFAEPFCRGFNWNDSTIDHTYKEDTFPAWSLLFFAIAPMSLAAFICAVAPMFPGSRKFEIHEWAFANIIAIAINEICTDFSKMYAGRLRPDFLNRLRINGYNATFPDPATTDYCAITSSIVHHGRLSFPSGHSSTAFVTMTLCTIFLFNRLRTFRQPEWRVAYFCVSIIPMTFAFTVAISRTRDNRHHFADIVAGALIGTVAAFIAFRLQFTYCYRRLTYIPTLFVREELPPVVVEEMPVVQ